MSNIARAFYAAVTPGYPPVPADELTKLLASCSVSIRGFDPGVPSLPPALASCARGRELFVLEYPQGFRVSVTPSFGPDGFAIRNISGLEQAERPRIRNMLTRILGAPAPAALSLVKLPSHRGL